MPTPARDPGLVDDHERCYRAVRSRDTRFDGVFYTAVRTTGIYCRPSCPAVTPKAGNVEFYRTAAAAHGSGFRACRRCRPDTTPGSPEWDVRADVVGRAMRMIRDGVVEHEGVPGLARRLGYTERHVGRVLRDELGAGPLALARSERARTARLLLESTAMPAADVAFAAGFTSVRQFNSTMQEVYAMSPTEIRTRGTGPEPGPSGVLRLRLPVRTPFDATGLLSFLDDHAIPGLESVEGTVFSRVLTLRHGLGAVRLDVADDGVGCELELQDSRDTVLAVQRCRALLDLDADPVAVDEVLSGDPSLAPLVAEVPGVRLPGAVDGFETAARTVLGQQVSVSGARTVGGRIVQALGRPHEVFGLTHAFPTPDRLAAVEAEDLPIPRQRGRALIALARAVDEGTLDLDPGSDPVEVRAGLVALPGIGPWTADYVAMRALGDPDVLLGGDLVLDRVMARLGIERSRAEQWRPWRSYAVVQLWREARRIQATGEKL
ncbi:DNA-3-methyladenine glycosylase 2 family protein [Solicola sp. PLA-1-18]|uniref:DNA-3-methyladenine glycosylase 2 family protein n=1 Tax=Solicola sp. PLA-1-18 TaxID=3380532 RepID=UPI003B7B3290